MHKLVFTGLFLLVIALATITAGCTGVGSEGAGLYKLKGSDVISDTNITTVKLANVSMHQKSSHQVNFELKFKYDLKMMSLMNDVVKSVKVTIRTVNPDFSISDVKTVNAEVIGSQPAEKGYSSITISPKAGDEFEVRFTLNSKSELSYSNTRGVVNAFTVRVTTPMGGGMYTVTLDYY